MDGVDEVVYQGERFLDMWHPAKQFVVYVLFIDFHKRLKNAENDLL